MTIDQFHENLINETEVNASADREFMQVAFVDLVVRYLEDAGEVSDFEPCYFRGQSGRHNVGIDGYAIDNADNSLRLFIAEPVLAPGVSLTQTEAKGHFGRLKAFYEDARLGRLFDIVDESAPARSLAEYMFETLTPPSRIRAYLLTDAIMSTRIKELPSEELGGVPFDFHIWDINRFFRAYSSRTGRDDLVVDFLSGNNAGLPCLEASTESSAYQSYLCVVSGSMLADIYDAYGSRLLEGNVRSFLSAKGSVNRGIRSTATNAPEMFFAYNNGIAATASDVKLTADSNGLRLIEATDLQIVNGGQTTASLSTTRRNDKTDLSRIFVPMKLSVVAPDLAGGMIPEISRCANTQNKVSDADFFSNHEYHRRLEDFSRRLWAPARPGMQHETRWFYERARGSYDNASTGMTLAERRRYLEMHPRDQKITKTDLAKSENSWLQHPDVVSRGAQTNFMVFANYISRLWAEDAVQFHEEYFKAAISRIILFRSTEKIVSSQQWTGFRANVVTYSIAKLSHELQRRRQGTLDFRKIWQEQCLSDALSTQLTVIAHSMRQVIVNASEKQQNVTQWCKRPDCWEAAQAVEIELSVALTEELVDNNVSKDDNRLARAQQQIDSGIDAQATVLSNGSDYWRSLLAWASEQRLISTDDEKILRIACSLPYKIPSDRQSRRLLLLKERLEREGFLTVQIANSVRKKEDGWAVSS